MKKFALDISKLPRRKLTWLRTGYEYHCYPSMEARQLWYYTDNVGEARWPHGFEFGHPSAGLNYRDDRNFLLHFVLQGELCHRSGDRTWIAKPNDAVLFDLSKPVRYRNESSRPVHFCHLLFDGRGMKQVAGRLNTHANPHFPMLNRRRVLRIFRELIENVAVEPHWYEAKVSALITELLVELFKVRPLQRVVDGRANPASAPAPVRNALEHLARYYYRPWSLKELCHTVGQSMSYLSHVFKKETGYSPMQYLNRYRIEQAKALLSSTRMPIEQISQSVGITDAKYFARLFQQINGASPRAYRMKATAVAAKGRA